MRRRRRAFPVVCVAGAITALAAAAALAGVAKVEGGIEFSYNDPYAGSVHLAGVMNGWSTSATPLTMDEKGVWRVVVQLDPGTYEYKFVVNGSEWVADPENPQVVGAYGNSEITIDENGEPVIGRGAAAAISNTSLNARVNVNGWYRASYDTRSDVPSEPRWRLDRPAHEIYLSVNPTVTPQVKGSATLRFDTGVGDITQISADLYSGRATLEGGPFTVTGFYNEEVLQFDDPLETVGHIDVPGTITEEHVLFGRGSQGALLETTFLGASLSAAYANEYDFDRWNNPSIYDNTGTDLIAARFARPVGPVTLGATYTAHEDGWWIDFTGSNESPQLDEYIADSGSTSDWFELATSERWAGLDISWPAMPGRLDVRAEYAGYSMKSRWDMGNHEKVEGESLSDGAIDVPVAETKGWLGKLILDGPQSPLNLRFEATRAAIESMSAGDEVVGFTAPLWAEPARRQYTNVNVGTVGAPLTVNVHGPAPKRDEWATEFDAGFALGIFDVGFEYDQDVYTWTFPDTVASIEGVDWEGTASRVALRGKASVLEDDRLWVGLEMESWGYDTDEGLWDALDTSELILKGGWELYKDWGVLLDLRHVTYKDVPDSTETSDESFWNPYLALVYRPRPNVELRIGYGVSPTTYADTPVEGRGNGREMWRAEYLWGHGDAKPVDAEAALEDARTIGLMAVIMF